jgi:hypothetical protein
MTAMTATVIQLPAFDVSTEGDMMRRLSRQVLRCAAVLVASGAGAGAIFLVMLLGPRLEERWALLLTLALALCLGLVVVSVLAAMAPTLEVLAILRRQAVRATVEVCDLRDELLARQASAARIFSNVPAGQEASLWVEAHRSDVAVVMSPPRG